MTYDKQDLHLKYQKNKKIYEKLQQSVISDLEAILTRKGIKFVHVIGRVKEFDSLFQKIEAREKNDSTSKEPLDEINDVVGVRIILLFVKDLENIEEILVPTFNIHDVKKFNKSRGDDHFGYESDHYILTYKDVDGPHYDELKTRKIELQVRTILMDAWDSVSHFLDYKNSEAIPSDLKRVFFGLSGMFVVADYTFQNLKESSTKNRSKQLDSIKRPIELLDQEINLDTIKAYLQFKFPERWKLEERLSRNYRDNMYSDLVKEIKDLNKYKKIKDLDNAISHTLNLAEEVEKIQFPGGDKKALVGMVRASLDIYDDEYFYGRFGITDPSTIANMSSVNNYVKNIYDAREKKNKKK